MEAAEAQQIGGRSGDARSLGRSHGREKQVSTSLGRNHEIALRKTTDGEFSILAMLRTLPGGRRRSKWLRHGRECGRGF